jgi:putative transposase
LSDIVRSWKTFTAAAINKQNGRSGPFWARDYFDRYMRDEAQLARTLAYIEENPVKAGLVSSPGCWPWSSAARED